MKNFIKVSTLLMLLVFSTNCDKEEEIEEDLCPGKGQEDKYVNTATMEDNTLEYWGKTYNLDDVTLYYTTHGDYAIRVEESDIDLDLILRPPAVKNCYHVMQTESTLPYASKLGSGSSYGFSIVLWDHIHYLSASSCQTSDNDEKYGYVKMTANETTFTLEFQDLEVSSQMFWQEPYQKLSMKLTLPYDCAEYCPQ
jgi:hypothetical protein